MKNVFVGLLVVLVLSLGGYILVDTGVIKIGKELVIENPENPENNENTENPFMIHVLIRRL